MMMVVWKLRIRFLLLSLAVSLLPGTVSAISTIVNSSSDWCEAINSARPGDEIVFAQGSYNSACWITARGEPGSPVTVRSQSEEPTNRSVFAYSGSSSNVLEFHGTAYLILRGFSFGPTQDAVDAIRIRSANDIVIERNLFQGIGGVSIAANDDNTQRITVRDNSFKYLKYTCLYFGCQDGSTCVATDVLIERNLIDGVTTPYDPSAIGYGLEIKLNSYGTVRDNTIYRTKGPGIMVYGSNRGGPASTIEGNYVEGSLTEGGIVVGGGPAIVRNNVLVANAYGGISAQNYNGRNLQQNVWIVHNTILNNADSGINVESWASGSGNVIAFNAVSLQNGTLSIRPSSPAGIITGNITCGGAPPPCFVNSTLAPYDLWPSVSGSPLLDAAGRGTDFWRPVDDFMGISRGSNADVGAFERTSLTIDHLVGGGSPRPLRVTGDTAPPQPPTDLRIIQ